MRDNDKGLNLLRILKSIDDSPEGRSAREQLFEELNRQSFRDKAASGRAKNRLPYIKTHVRAGTVG